jgi:bifunctional non-homologous end joining protein LigD
MNKLAKYQKKRDFLKTKEPKGKIGKSFKKLKFVVQHHIATKDHYDFRLEWEGVLKSWAVPKGPSYNPQEKRLAIEVEDHPLSYRNFEGVIPKGEYGAGPVMLWDEGTWDPITNVKEGFKNKIFKFTLNGKKLMGNWALIHMEEKQWLLIKEKDEFSNDIVDLTKYDKSIRTGRTMKEIIRDESNG